MSRIKNEHASAFCWLRSRLHSRQAHRRIHWQPSRESMEARWSAKARDMSRRGRCKQLVENDRLLVLEGGSATIQFADGCKRTMERSELLTVSSTSPCALESAGAPATAGVQGLPDAATAMSSPSFAAVEQGATSQLVPVGAGAATGGALDAAVLVPGLVGGGWCRSGRRRNRGRRSSRSLLAPSRRWGGGCCSGEHQ